MPDKAWGTSPSGNSSPETRAPADRDAAAPSAHKLTTCTFCGVGCGIYLETAGNAIIGAYPSLSHPANLGRICVRGWHVHEVATSPNRLTVPLVRRNGHHEPVSWDDAFGFVAERLDAVRASHGPDAIGFATSPRCSNEEAYLLQKLARTVVGTNNVTHGVGLTRTHSINALLQMLGVPAGTSSIGELAVSDVIVVDGIDLGKQLPTAGGWVIRARLAGAKVIATGSRSHVVAKDADQFLQIRPGTDPVVYGAMAKVIVDRGLMNLPFIKAHCRGYEEYIETIRAFDLLGAAEICGVAPEQIEQAAVTYGEAKAAMILYSTGVEARGAECIRAVINLALLTGNLGREGAGVIPLTEQNNLQGGCDMGMLPDRLPGYARLDDATARARLARLWGGEPPLEPGVEIVDALVGRAARPLRALWLDRHDPITWGGGTSAAALAQLELLICQQLFMTEAARLAHVVLPVVSFGEEQVTFTSAERRVQLTAKAIEPPSGLLPAWAQIVRVARRMGAPWEYGSSADVMDEIRQAVPEYGATSYENLAREYGRQWPCTPDKPLGTRFLFEDGLPDRGFSFAPMERPAAFAQPPEGFPLTLVLGHSLYYWNRNVLIQHSETLKREYGILLLDYPEGFVEISVEDADRLGVRDGKPVRLLTDVGSATSAARVTDEVRPGMVFVPFFLQEVAQQLLGEPRIGGPARTAFVRVERA